MEHSDFSNPLNFMRTGQKRSTAFEHFLITDPCSGPNNNYTATCKHCYIPIKGSHKSSSNLIKHLKRKHPDIPVYNGYQGPKVPAIEGMSYEDSTNVPAPLMHSEFMNFTDFPQNLPHASQHPFGDFGLIKNEPDDSSNQSDLQIACTSTVGPTADPAKKGDITIESNPSKFVTTASDSPEPIQISPLVKDFDEFEPIVSAALSPVKSSKSSSVVPSVSGSMMLPVVTPTTRTTSIASALSAPVIALPLDFGQSPDTTRKHVPPVQKRFNAPSVEPRASSTHKVFKNITGNRIEPEPSAIMSSTPFNQWAMTNGSQARSTAQLPPHRNSFEGVGKKRRLEELTMNQENINNSSENSFNPPPTKRKLLAIPGEKGIFESEDWKDETTMFSHIKYDTLVNTKNIEQFSFRSGTFFLADEKGNYCGSQHGHAILLWRVDSKKLYVSRALLFADTPAYLQLRQQIEAL